MSEKISPPSRELEGSFNVPDGVYDAGWTSTTLYIDVPEQDILITKASFGPRSPIPIPTKVKIQSGKGAILKEQEQSNIKLADNQRAIYRTDGSIAAIEEPWEDTPRPVDMNSMKTVSKKIILAHIKELPGAAVYYPNIGD